MILVGDIGGTHSRLSLARAEGASYRLDHERVYDTPADLPALVRHYLVEVRSGSIDALAFCGAGPVLADGSIRLTNNTSVLDPAVLAAAAGTCRARVVNDFEAVAQCLPALAETNLWKIGGGEVLAGAPRVVIGAGTGLGVAAMICCNGQWKALPGEGGHADLAAVDDEELAVLQVLRTKHARVKAEHVLSGPGLARLYSACGGQDNLQGPAISKAARAGDQAAQQAVRLFTRWLGRLAGNLALTLLARGGVYIAGGIVPGWGADFDTGLFREGFEDKAPFASTMAQMPTFVITHPQPGLLGLARLASEQLKASPPSAPADAWFQHDDG